MFVTAAVSPVWHKAEQQYNFCLSKAHERFLLTKAICCFLKSKSFLHILCEVDSSRLRSASSYKTETTAFFCLRPRGRGAWLWPHRARQLFPVVLLWARRPPFLFPQGARCSGARPSPWWCLRGCLLPFGPWCPCWGGGNTTTNPSEPAAPWTTAKGTGEGQGQVPREGGWSCRPLGWPRQHTKPPSCPPHHCCWGRSPSPAAGARQARPEAASTCMAACGIS